MFQTRTARLVLTAQLPTPPGTPYPGTCPMMVSDDQGESWRAWTQTQHPRWQSLHEAVSAQLREGRFSSQWSARGPGTDGTWIVKCWESQTIGRASRGLVTDRIALPLARVV